MFSASSATWSIDSARTKAIVICSACSIRSADRFYGVRSSGGIPPDRNDVVGLGLLEDECRPVFVC